MYGGFESKSTITTLENFTSELTLPALTRLDNNRLTMTSLATFAAKPGSPTIHFQWHIRRITLSETRQISAGKIIRCWRTKIFVHRIIYDRGEIHVHLDPPFFRFHIIITLSFTPHMLWSYSTSSSWRSREGLKAQVEVSWTVSNALNPATIFFSP